MGLDMYLEAKIRFSKYGRGEDSEATAMELRKRFGIPPSNNLETVELVFEVAYWRKANQIHSWFVEKLADGLDECQMIHVSREDMARLLADVNKVLDSTKLKSGKVVNGYNVTAEGRKAILEDGKVMEDHTVAQAVLPPSEGFFFGSTGFDQWYWQDLEYTKAVLEDLLNNPALEGAEFQYQASW